MRREDGRCRPRGSSSSSPFHGSAESKWKVDSAQLTTASTQRKGEKREREEEGFLPFPRLMCWRRPWKRENASLQTA